MMGFVGYSSVWMWRWESQSKLIAETDLEEEIGKVDEAGGKGEREYMLSIFIRDRGGVSKSESLRATLPSQPKFTFTKWKRLNLFLQSSWKCSSINFGGLFFSVANLRN